MVFSYQMPTHKVCRRLYIDVWKHGLSLYGWQQGGDAGFTARHPEAVTRLLHDAKAGCYSSGVGASMNT